MTLYHCVAVYSSLHSLSAGHIAALAGSVHTQAALVFSQGSLHTDQQLNTLHDMTMLVTCRHHCCLCLHNVCLDV